MTIQEAIAFLERHQPLPPTRTVEEGLLQRFDEVRRYIGEVGDVRGLSLLLNAFGEGDGHGIYQLVESTVRRFPDDVVVPALRAGLTNPRGSVRYWNAQFSANYKRSELVQPLIELLWQGNVDERLAAVTALEGIDRPDVKRALQDALSAYMEEPVKELIRETI